MVNPEDPPIPDLFKPSPYLDNSINEKIIKSEIEGGVDITKLPEAAVLEIQTENTLYTLEKRGDEFYLSGSEKYCPQPTRVTITGSAFGSMLKQHFIGVGLSLEFILLDSEAPHPISTSRILEVRQTK